jgi:hypothetical protein
VNKINQTESWPQKMAQATKYTEKNVKPGAKDLFRLLKRS